MILVIHDPKDVAISASNMSWKLCEVLVSHGQTLCSRRAFIACSISAHAYRVCTAATDTTIDYHLWYNYHRCGDGCKMITRFGDPRTWRCASFEVELLQVCFSTSSRVITCLTGSVCTSRPCELLQTLFLRGAYILLAKTPLHGLATWNKLLATKSSYLST